MTGCQNKAIYIGYGESEDPLPEKPQLTRYRVFAGPCRECSCAGRKIFPGDDFMVIVCDKCGDKLSTTISVADQAEVTYIYWCNSSKFASDDVELSSQDSMAIEKLIADYSDQYEVPHWAVVVIAGRCCSSEACINFSCPYLVKSQ